MAKELSRRTFVTRSTASSLAIAGSFSSGVHAEARPTARLQASDTIQVGLIGCGGMGRHNLSDFLRVPEVKVTALCDIDPKRITEAEQMVAKRRGDGKEKYSTHKDFRELLDKKDVDCVIVGTPDHWHALPTIFACQAGKDVYCEKPISHNIVEGRMMVNAVKRNKRVCQIGTQQRSGEHFQKAIRLIQGGALGDVHLTRTWNHSQEGPNGIGNPENTTPPSGVDYDMWLGPAPKRDFNPNRFHYQWRWFFDYAAGMVGDWNVHLQDIVHQAMGVGQPKSVSATGGKVALQDNRDTPDLLQATYQFEGPAGPFVQIYSMRKFNQNKADWSPGHGIQFVGSNGTMNLNRGGFEILAEGDRIEASKSGGSDQHWPHVQNFIECVKSREKPRSDIESMHETTLCCHLANISMRVGRTVYWSTENERCYRDPEYKHEDSDANSLLGREYRKPWTLPKIDA